jgi:hypothetical protein
VSAIIVCRGNVLGGVVNGLNEPVSGETTNRPEMNTQTLKRESAPHLALKKKPMNELSKDS